jgi:hypothetical protein
VVSAGIGEVAGAALGVCVLVSGVTGIAGWFCIAGAAAATVVVKILEICMMKTPDEHAANINESAWW